MILSDFKYRLTLLNTLTFAVLIFLGIYALLNWNALNEGQGWRMLPVLFYGLIAFYSVGFNGIVQVIFRKRIHQWIADLVIISAITIYLFNLLGYFA